MYEILSKIASEQQDPAQAQKLIYAKFCELLENGPLIQWQPDLQTPPETTRIVVGVAPSWNAGDRELLKWLEAVNGAVDLGRFTIQIFDAESCRTHADFQRYLPGIGDVYQFPVAGVWQSGLKPRYASGFAAGELLREVIPDTEMGIAP